MKLLWEVVPTCRKESEFSVLKNSPQHQVHETSGGFGAYVFKRPLPAVSPASEFHVIAPLTEATPGRESPAAREELVVKVVRKHTIQSEEKLSSLARDRHLLSPGPLSQRPVP